ncbi:FAD dependent oxidoreductase, partial [Crucibulum laeve]
YVAGDSLYTEGITHWANGSGTQVSQCVVEPVNSKDVATILRFLGSTRTPFAVKGAGHHANPGFSSTTGVHISMRQFNEITYNEAAQTVRVGAGLLWDDIYAKLAPHNVSVVGARALGVGVPGFLLGGGYSWLGNQYGLALDNVMSYELVQPTGKIVEVTQASQPDLFFALKGGGNNFGIVTKFTLKTYPQGPVWGGLIMIDGSHIPEVADAVTDFSLNIDDPKAGMDTLYINVNGSVVVTQLVFYDGPAPPPGIFEAILAIPSFVKDVQTRSFLSFMASGGPFPVDQRTLFHSVSMLQFSPTISEVIRNETVFWGEFLKDKSASVVSYAIEPFHPGIYAHNTTATAFPADRSIPFYPYIIWFCWKDPAMDDVFYDAARQSAEVIADAAIAEGQTAVAYTPMYINPSLIGTPLERLYGKNIPRLRKIKAKVDPQNVMGLAGGFKL